MIRVEGCWGRSSTGAAQHLAEADPGTSGLAPETGRVGVRSALVMRRGGLALCYASQIWFDPSYSYALARVRRSRWSGRLRSDCPWRRLLLVRAKTGLAIPPRLPGVRSGQRIPERHALAVASSRDPGRLSRGFVAAQLTFWRGFLAKSRADLRMLSSSTSRPAKYLCSTLEMSV